MESLDQRPDFREWCYGRFTFQVIRIDPITLGIFALKGLPYDDSLVLFGLDLAIVGFRLEVRTK